MVPPVANEGVEESMLRTMKQGFGLALIALALVGLAPGCGILEDDRIPPGDGDNAETNNEDEIVSCGDNADCDVTQECVTGLCEDHLVCSPIVEEGCPDGTIRASVDGEDGCYAECDDGVCPAEQSCVQNICTGTPDAVFEEGCTVTWTGCSDGKEYEVSCTEGTCACIVNDVDTGSFDTDTPCSDDAFHREVNDGCDWLVPGVN